jgi:protein TonB
MFNNLIESTSHSGEMKRRGVFFVGALCAYALMFVAIGVAGVFAYDAHLDRQSLDLVAIMTPAEVLPVTPPRDSQPPRRNQAVGSENRIAQRTDTPPSSDRTRVANGIAVTSTQPPPLAPGEPWQLGALNTPGTSLDPGTSPVPGGSDGRPTVADTEPPPLRSIKPAAERKIVTVSKGPVAGSATYLPQPPYPPIALAAKQSGTVVVQILIDEKGNVISARALSGPSLLQDAAEKAARRAKFSPTTLGGVPVRVSGVINYNFKRT